MTRLVTVSNGDEFFRIDPGDLDDANADGFHRPFEQGQTIVGNEQYLFEIPLSEVDSAQTDGLREVLGAERRQWSRRQGSGGVSAGVSDATPVSAGLPNAGLPNAGLPNAGLQNLRADASDSTRSDSAVVVPEATELMAGLTQAEREAEQEALAAQQQLDETEGWRWYVLWSRMWLDARRQTIVRQLRGSGISAAVHVAILLILASLFMKVDDEPKGLFLSATPTSDKVIEEVIIEPSPLEITEPTETTDSESPAEAEVVLTEAVAAPDFMAAVSGAAIKPPARPASSGVGKARPTKKPSFFGRRVAAVNYVFVIDNSNSMTQGRFETALNELVIAVNQLTPKQRFYVIFYSDTAYPMFHPQPASELVNATPKNKEKLQYWLNTVQLCLKTNGRQAIAAAFSLQPDVIFVLGDGAFTDGASNFFAARPQTKIPLHTLGMEVKPKDAVAFQQLAKANGGTYKDVGVADGARAFARQNPRPRNSVRGPVWGITLKPKPKLK
ncbi:MAG: VWA domain-containing protein [Rubripirellula sp.]